MVFPFLTYSLEPIIQEIKKYKPTIKIGYHVDFNFYAVPGSYPFSELYNNKEVHSIIEKNMRIVDRVFVSNRNLAEAIYEKTDEKYKKGYIDNIVHQPLLFNKDYFDDVSENEDRDKPTKFRIGIIADPSHLPDLNYVKGILSEVQNKHKDKVEVVVVGFDGFHKKRNYLKGFDFTYVPRIDIFDYYQKVNDLSFDLFIIPAKDNVFNQTSKNYIKYIELAYLNVPVIISSVIQDIMPEKFRVQHNGTGLVCKEKDNWLQEIDQGINKTDKIKQITYAAYEHILNYNIQIPNNLKLIESLYSFKQL